MKERREFMTKMIGGAVAAAGTMWLPPQIKAKVEEKGVKALTLEEVNEAFKALTERVGSLEDQVALLQADVELLKAAKDPYKPIIGSTESSTVTGPIFLGMEQE